MTENDTLNQSDSVSSDDRINIEDFLGAATKAEYHSQIDELKTIIDDHLPAWYLSQEATYLFGSPTHAVEIDGITQEMSYTWDDIFTREQDVKMKGFDATQQSMRSQMMYILESQDEIIDSLPPADQGTARLTRDIMSILTIRFSESTEDVNEPWPITFNEGYYEAYILEVLRRVTFPTSHGLIYGAHEDGDIDSFIRTFDKEAWRMQFLKNPKKPSEVKTLGDWYDYLSSLTTEDFEDVSPEAAAKKVSTRTFDDWISVVHEQERHILLYLKDRVSRMQLTGKPNFYRRIYRYGQPLFGSETLEDLEQRQKLIGAISDDVQALSDLAQLPQLITKHLGPDATIESLFEALSDPDMGSIDW